jgi:hypothetical protein
MPLNPVIDARAGRMTSKLVDQISVSVDAMNEKLVPVIIAADAAFETPRTNVRMYELAVALSVPDSRNRASTPMLMADAPPYMTIRYVS